ncbi:MATE family efflux transporter [Steroidobacter flavus]|uniref:Multidrug-efflux transporter n=1 Tax=Steroidobacter flavus TaxID=1842136 RepID=A0ABV8SKN5_9GAMM
MRDFTKDSITRHLLVTAAPVAISMLAQILNQLVDLYFVTKLGAEATAGVSAAGNVVFAIAALTQVLAAGTVALVSLAVGRQDRTDANQIFNQSFMLAIVWSAIAIAVLYAVMGPYLGSLSADAATYQAGVTFTSWVLPGLVLLMPMTVLSSALRGTGIVQPATLVYVLTVVVNAILAPVLIAGWGTGIALGVQGAGLATTLASIVGIVVLMLWFPRLQPLLALTPSLMRPRFAQWRRLLAIGLPAGGEMVLMFVFVAIIYFVIRDFGPQAQAGFGIGWRIMHTILLPGISIAFAVGPIAGQNFGAGNSDRVRETFRRASVLGTTVMIVTAALVHGYPDAMLRLFASDPQATEVAVAFLRSMSWMFVAQGLVYICSMMFQGLGNTRPSLLSSGIRLLTFAVPAIWLSFDPHFYLEQVWYLCVASVVLQAAVSLWLLDRQLKLRLVVAPEPLAARNC